MLDVGVLPAHAPIPAHSRLNACFVFIVFMCHCRSRLSLPGRPYYACCHFLTAAMACKTASASMHTHPSSLCVQSRRILVHVAAHLGQPRASFRARWRNVGRPHTRAARGVLQVHACRHTKRPHQTSIPNVHTCLWGGHNHCGSH